MAGLTETRLTDSGMCQVGEHTVIHSGEDQANLNGVALVLDGQMNKSMVSWQAVCSRILRARLLHKNGHITVITAYAPTEENPIFNEDSFYTSPESVIHSVPTHDKLVVLGDFNTETGCNRIVIGNNNWIFFIYCNNVYLHIARTRFG